MRVKTTPREKRRRSTIREEYWGTTRSLICILDLAWAKSEAADYIYSLLEQNVKSCNAKRRRQRKRRKNKK